MFSTANVKDGRKANQNSQCRGTLDTEFAVEYEHRLLGRVPADRRSRFRQTWTKEQGFHLLCSVDVHGTFYVTAFVFVVETAVDDMEIADLILIFTVHEVVKLGEYERAVLRCI